MTTSTSTALYQVREFAERFGVTIRTLHHYDHLGLLKPTIYSESGYRLYSDADVPRLQQIVTLKFLGFSLKQIGELLDGGVLELPAMLRMQREIMEEKRRQLDRAIRAVDSAERIILSKSQPDRDVFIRIIEVITMEQNFQDKEWLKKYYTEEQLADFETRALEHPGEAEQGTMDWMTLIGDVERAIADGVDPASREGRSLAARWSGLIESFTRGNTNVAKSLDALYADSPNWPATFKKPYSDEVEEFIRKAGFGGANSGAA